MQDGCHEVTDLGGRVDLDAAAHPETVAYGNALSYRITAARHHR